MKTNTSKLSVTSPEKDEYYVENESPVYYALKSDQGYWSCINGDKYHYSNDMVNIEFFPTLKDAIEIQNLLEEETQIRRVKVIDIGMC